jgi:hypothetical protein
MAEIIEVHEAFVSRDNHPSESEGICHDCAVDILQTVAYDLLSHNSDVPPTRRHLVSLLKRAAKDATLLDTDDLARLGLRIKEAHKHLELT